MPTRCPTMNKHTHMNWWFVNVCNIQLYICMYICKICMYLCTFAVAFANSQKWTWMYVREFRRYLLAHIMEHTNILRSSCMSYLFPHVRRFFWGRTLMLKKLWPGRCTGFRPRRVSVLKACFGCSPLVLVTWFWMFFFLSRFEEGVFQLQKLEILERSLPKKSTAQQVWQPADFFRVDSQDLHVCHFWPSDPFCCGDFITLHVLGTWGPGTAQKTWLWGDLRMIPVLGSRTWYFSFLNQFLQFDE